RRIDEDRRDGGATIGIRYFSVTSVTASVMGEVCSSWMTIRHQFATLDLYRAGTRFVKDCNGVDNGSTVSVPSAPVRSGHRACTWQRWCPAARTSRPPPSPVRQADRADGRFPCPPLYDQGPIAAVIDVVVDWTPVDS